MRSPAASSPAASELVRELRRYAAPWRRRTLQESALVLLALGLGLAACAWWSPALAALVAAAAIWLAAARARRQGERRLREIETRLACEGAIGAALECAHEAPLGALAARDLVRRLRATALPGSLHVRPACWLALGAALFAAAATLGAATERARSETAALPLGALEAGSIADAAASSASSAEAEAVRAQEAQELRAQRERGALGAAEFAARMERLSKSYARSRADSSMSRPANAAGASERGADPGSGAAAGGAATGAAPEAAGLGSSQASAGNTAWAELPERYRRCVARYFGRRD